MKTKNGRAVLRSEPSSEGFCRVFGQVLGSNERYADKAAVWYSSPNVGFLRKQISCSKQSNNFFFVDTSFECWSDQTLNFVRLKLPLI